MKKSVEDFLENKRLLTTKIKIYQPTYVFIKVNLQIYLKPDFTKEKTGIIHLLFPSESLREAHEFRIPRSAIRPDPVLLESILHVDSSGFVEAHAPPLHDSLDLCLARIIEPLSGVAGLNVSAEIKSRRGKSRFDVIAERSR